MKALQFQQQGVTLAITMIILFVVTIVGIASLKTTSLEEKMAGNVQQANRAFEAAESGAALGWSAILTTGEPENITPRIGMNITLEDVDFASEAGGDDKNTVATINIRTAEDAKSSVRRRKKLDDIYSAVHFENNNFEIESLGESFGNARGVIEQGVIAVSPQDDALTTTDPGVTETGQ